MCSVSNHVPPCYIASVKGEDGMPSPNITWGEDGGYRMGVGSIEEDDDYDSSTTQGLPLED